MTDLGILSILYSILHEKIKKGSKIFQNSHAMIKSFILFYFILIIADIIIFNINYSNILTTRRIHLYVLLFPYFNLFSKTDLENTLTNLIIITKFSLPIYFYQIVFNQQLFVGNTSEHDMMGGRLRFGNFPPFTVPFIFFLIFNSKYRNRYFWLTISSFAILFSSSRSLVIAIFLSFLLSNIINLKNMKKSLILSVTFVLIFIISLIFIPGFNERMIDGVNEINYVIENYTSDNLAIKGTFSYRIAFLIERIEYLTKDISNILFGIGGIAEQNLQHTIFKIGIIDETTGMTQQINTGDNSWVIMFLRFGFLGTIIYLVTIYFSFLVNAIKQNKSIYMNITISYLLFLFIRTFVTADLATMQILFVPLLFYHLAFEEKKEL